MIRGVAQRHLKRLHDEKLGRVIVEHEEKGRGVINDGGSDPTDLICRVLRVTQHALVGHVGRSRDGLLCTVDIEGGVGMDQVVVQVEVQVIVVPVDTIACAE